MQTVEKTFSYWLAANGPITATLRLRQLSAAAARLHESLANLLRHEVATMPPQD
jgi:hypothetical protein